MDHVLWISRRLLIVVGCNLCLSSPYVWGNNEIYIFIVFVSEILLVINHASK